MRGFIMAKRKKHDLKAFEEYLRHLYKTSEPQPFTTEEIELLLKSCVKPKDLAKYRNEMLVALMQEAHLRKQARAEACFRYPSQVHSLGELLNSVLVIKRIFISQLAQELEMTAEEIADYIENRPPTRPLREDQMKKLAELTGIALEEIRRIAGETVKSAEVKTPASVEATSPKKPRRLYPMSSDHSAVWMIREEESSNYKKR
jgi:hypothetical protein